MIEQDIINDVADIYGITVADILSKRRVRRYADARTVICYLLCTAHGFTTIEAGKLLNRTHATAIYFNRKAIDWMKSPLLNKRGVCAINELKKRYG